MLFSTAALVSTVLSTLTLGVSASPLAVWTPPVTDPNTSTVWTVGTTVNVTWDASSPPSQVTNPIGRIVLAKGGLQNWDLGFIASGFSLYTGWTTLQVPDVEPGDDYAIVLFGDSGNYSPEFSIISA